jgi:hypothetical protein
LAEPGIPRIVAVDRDRVAGGIGYRDDRALVIDEERPAVGVGGTFVPEQGFVGGRSVDVAPDDRARRGEFGQQPFAVVEELGDSRTAARRLE